MASTKARQAACAAALRGCLETGTAGRPVASVGWGPRCSQRPAATRPTVAIQRAMAAAAGPRMLHLVNEHLTSQTCLRCLRRLSAVVQRGTGREVHGLKYCGTCEALFDRDVIGAGNIYRAHLAAQEGRPRPPELSRADAADAGPRAPLAAAVAPPAYRMGPTKQQQLRRDAERVWAERGRRLAVVAAVVAKRSG